MRIQPGRRVGAFTLTESLVVILIVGVLLAIALPSLRMARDAARSLHCRANLRTCAQAIHSYTGDFNEVYPYFADASRDPAFENGGYGLGFGLQSLHWPMVMEDRLGPTRFSEVRFCPDDPVLDLSMPEIDDMHPASYIFPGSYWMGLGFASDPALWIADANPEDLSLYRPVRASEVYFPSKKGLLAELVPYHRLQRLGLAELRQGSLRDLDARGTFHIAFVDGSVRPRSRHELVPGITPGTGKPNTPVIQTPNGVHGTDLAGIDR